MNMGYFNSSHIEFSRVMHYNLFVAQTVHLVRFVPQHKYRIIFGPYHAQGLENTTSVVHRHPSNSLRWHGTHSMFLQQAQTLIERKSEHLSPPPGLSLSGAVGDRSEENRQTPVPIIFMNLQVTHETTSSISKGFRGKNIIFTHY